MHETQYRDYKSGLAKTRFVEDIEKMRSQSQQTTSKTTVAVKEKQAPNRNNYNKDKVNYPVAMAGYLLYSLNTELTKKEPYLVPEHNVWNAIGYWRNVMNIKLTYTEKEYEVDINKNNKDEFQFVIDGEEMNVNLIFIDKGEVDFKLGDNTYFASIATVDEGSKVSINGSDFIMTRNDLLSSEYEAGDGDEIVASEETHVISPIPGRVFKINVAEGDELKKGEVAIVIEAMKMENNIAVKRDCVIKSIIAQQDAMVEAGAALIEIE